MPSSILKPLLLNCLLRIKIAFHILQFYMYLEIKGLALFHSVFICCNVRKRTSLFAMHLVSTNAETCFRRHLLEKLDDRIF